MEGKFKKNYLSLDDVRKSIEFDGHLEEISFTSFESLLHPQFCEIIEICRERHPTTKFWLITNGTIPIKGRYKKAISMLNKVGLSIDGGSKAVFESIRIGAVFEDFIENTKAIVEIRKQTGSPEELTFAFTATSTNLHELVDVVRLAHQLGVPQVWAQAMESKNEDILAKISDIVIDRLDPAVRTSLVDAAREEAKRLGVELYFSEGLYPIPPKEKEATPELSDNSYVKLCQYPWREPAQISEFADGYVVLPCCYINNKQLLAEKYGLKLSEIKPMNEVYNSAAFWKFRESMMNGQTSDVCGNCQAARGYSWKPS